MKNSSPSCKLQVYFFTVGLSAFLFLAFFVTLNYMVDPYFIHQWDSPLLHRPSPAQQKIMPWSKTYAAYRFRPEIVFLGSSRSEIGLPTNSHLFSGKRVFNLAISGASVGDAAKMLEHTSFFHHPELVVWGLDYGWQFREKTGNTDFTNALVARDSLYPLRRTLLNIKRSVSMAMTVDSLKILFGQSEQSCRPLLAYNGYKSPECLQIIMDNEGGTKKAFEEVLKKKEPLGNPSDVAATIQFLDRAIGDSCGNGTVLRFFIHPIHALAELSYWSTLEEDLENWKRSLTKMVDARQQGGCDIKLFDFSGFNNITTEEIPQATGKENMQHYWEQSHYNGEVGMRILETVLAAGRDTCEGDFGIELHPDTIEEHLFNLRQARQKYIDAHPKETANILR
jgi:hypothetical protein